MILMHDIDGHTRLDVQRAWGKRALDQMLLATTQVVSSGNAERTSHRAVLWQGLRDAESPGPGDPPS